jgi:pimeloyl-ACP methyl ester carboxylesterase
MRSLFELDHENANAAHSMKGRTMKRWIKLAARFSLLASLAALVAGFTLEHIARWRETKSFPRVGRSVDIGGRTMNIACIGAGSPAVILDSSFGAPGYSWVPIQSKIAEFARVCWFDRAGYGWSDPGPYPQTSRSNAQDLHALLHAAGIRPPFVMVGHSFAGYNIRLYNSLYPNDVAGAVLVDSAQEDEGDRLPRRRGRRPPSYLKYPLYLAARTLEATGVLRVNPVPLFLPRRQPPPDFTPAQTATFNYLLRRSVTGHMSEGMGAWDSMDQARTSGSFADKPLLIVTAGRSFHPGDPAADEDAQVWIHELQPKLVALSTRGRQIIVGNSDHSIPEQAPQAVVEAVRQVVVETRQ